MTDAITVLGIGNQLMMDDGIGIYIVNELMKENYLGLNYMIGESDIDYCLEVVYENKRIVIIDAMMAGKTPGEVTILPLDTLTYYNTEVFSSHNFHFLNMMKNAKTKVDGYMIGVEPEKIDFYYGLSSRLENHFVQIMDNVKKELKIVFDKEVMK